MKLQLPLKEISINQYFGNPYPKYFQLGLKGHNGIDFRASHGTPVYASHDGVANYEIDSQQGHGIVIRSLDTIEGKFYKTIYWHLCDSAKEPRYLSPIEGKVDFPVKVGDLIGYADNTGFTEGDHLHFGFKFVEQNESNGVWYNLGQSNGFMGAVDPFPYIPQVPYRFSGTYNFGDENMQVNNLQHYLYQHGFMDLVPYDQAGYYGPKTSKAVLAFQESKWNLSWYEKSVLKGQFVGPKTIQALNG